MRCDNWFQRVWQFDEDQLALPLRWREPAVVAIRGEVFEKADERIDRVFAIMALCPQHSFVISTKLIELAIEYLNMAGARRNIPVYNAAAKLVGNDFSHFPADMAQTRSSGGTWWPLSNVWIGTFAENQETLNPRARYLAMLAEAGWNTVLSCEPLLGPIDLWRSLNKYGEAPDGRIRLRCDPPHPRQYPEGQFRPGCGCGEWPAPTHWLGWLIAGGETGPEAQPAHPDWFRSLRDQCAEARVPFWFSGWGEWLPGPQIGELFTDDQLTTYPATRGPAITTCWECYAFRVENQNSGRRLDGREWDERPASMKQG